MGCRFHYLKFILSIFHIWLSIALSTQFSKAQGVTDYYTQLSEEKWFPRQAVRCMYQDSKGYLWIATNAGLYCYNNFELKNYNISRSAESEFSNNTLSNSINSIAEDHQGNILVSTESDVGVLDPATNKKIVLTKNYWKVPQVLVSKSGIVWFYNERQEIFRVRSENYSHKDLKPYISLSGLPDFKNTVIKQLYLSPNGELFMATSAGLYKIDQQNRSIITCFPGADINGVFGGDDGAIFVIKGQDLISLMPPKKISGYYTESPNLISGQKLKLLTGEASSLVVSASREKLFALSESDNHKSFSLLVDNLIKPDNLQINLVFVDRSLNIWLGTQKGLYKINRQKIGVHFYNQFLSNKDDDNKVNDIFYDKKNTVWIATSNQGLFALDLNNNQMGRVRLPVNKVGLIRRTFDGNLMVLADRKMLEVNQLNSASYKEYGNSYLPEKVFDMAEISPGEWWLAGWDNGLIQFIKPGTEAILEPSFFKDITKMVTSAYLFGILKDINNQIWLISRGDGAFRVDLKKKKIYHYTETGKLKIPSNRLVCIFQDSKGGIWIGTRGAGLLKYHPSSDSFEVFDIKDGLPSETVCEIVESSSGDIWVSTLNGLARFQQDQLLPFYPYGINDGIFNPEFSFSVGCSGPNNSMFFGSTNGFYQINYLSKSELSKTIPIVWTDFRILNGKLGALADSTSIRFLSQIQNDENIVLNSGNHSFSISFAALDYTDPDKTRYAYRLKGKENDWNFISGGPSGVQYLDLAPGEYDFQVKVSNGKGEWSNLAEQFHITILPGFWVSDVAIFLYILLFIGFTVSGRYLWKRWYKLNKDLRTGQEVSAIHNQQMIQFADLSHEIKNRLTLILGPLEEALKGKRVNQAVLNNLYEQAQRLKRLSDRIIGIRKSESGKYVLNIAEGNLHNHLSQMFYEMEPLAVVKNVALKMDIKSQETHGWYDKELLEIIILNILGNAIKYSVVDGQVSFIADIIHDQKNAGFKRYLWVRIIDNGIGIPQEDISQIMDLFYRASNTFKNADEFKGDGIGLNLVSRLIKIHHGEVMIESEPNVVTEVSIKIPVDKNEYSISELKMNVNDTQIILPDSDQEEAAIIKPRINLKPAEDTFKKSILVVDDEKEVVQLLANGLKSDFTIYTAESGREAVKILQDNSVDLIISDLSMPEMDGLTFCATVRNNKALGHLPFIILTARNSDEQKLVAFQSQVDDFMEKPFSIELIKWRVKGLLKQRENVAEKARKIVIPSTEIDFSDSPDEIFIQRVVNIIDQNMANEFLNADFLADEVNMSRATFYRKMESLFGETPSQYIKKYRLKKAVAFLELKKYTISEVAFKTGFKTLDYFSKSFHKEFGKSPSVYMNEN